MRYFIAQHLNSQNGRWLHPFRRTVETICGTQPIFMENLGCCAAK